VSSLNESSLEGFLRTPKEKKNTEPSTFQESKYASVLMEALSGASCSTPYQKFIMLP